jgi:hypothetical protein
VEQLGKGVWAKNNALPFLENTTCSSKERIETTRFGLKGEL